MGDSTTNVPTTDQPEVIAQAEAQANPSAVTVSDPSKDEATSKEILRESKPSENISIKAPSAIEASVPLLPIQTASAVSTPTAKIETVFEKLDLTSDLSDMTSDSVDSAKGVAESNADIKDSKNVQRNKSSVFATDQDKSGPDNIFSVKGTPSGRLNRRRDMSSTVFPVGCMGCKEDPSIPAEQSGKDLEMDHQNKKSTSVRCEQDARNPLTGVGIDYGGDPKKCNRRKDGNPVLGLGYDSEITSSASANRIPPGGYSKGLW